VDLEAERGDATGFADPTLEPARLRALRAGEFRPEAALDLHGLVARDARSRVEGFLRSARACGRRCVLIITGVGRRSEGEPVLRARLPDWIRGGAVANEVLAVQSARPADGGPGAFYVLLRRSAAGARSKRGTSP
jgi:DNA-nicking Smr family endonuclease